jgi:hypothetical protein
MKSVEEPGSLRYESILPLMDRLSGSGQLFHQAAEILAQIEGSLNRANGTEK